MAASAAWDEAAREDQLLARAVLRRLERARTDPAVALQMFLREETTKERIRLAPHQRVMLDFVMSHPRSVLRDPVGSSKTFLLTGLTLWFLGEDQSQRGAFISASATQAEKALSMVRDYVEGIAPGHHELHSVFPELWPSTREGDRWTHSQITVRRPAGIRDPSVTATGLEGKKLPGSRLGWIVVDDLLNRQNSRTKEGREAAHSYLRTTVLSRRDVSESRIVVSNTPWHRDDLTYMLERAGWPTLTMDCEGPVTVTNTDWTSDELRPSRLLPGTYRLVQHDAPAYVASHGVPEDVPFGEDASESVPLWPERYPASVLQGLLEDEGEDAYNMSRRCQAPADSGRRVRPEWIELCKANARELGVHDLCERYDRQWPTFTGVDIGVGLEEQHAFSALLTFALLPSEHRLLLDVDVGRFEGQLLVDKVLDKHDRYGSIVRVENNAAQDLLLQWIRADARRRNKLVNVPLRAHTTGRNKADPRIGLESVFVEVEKGLWLLPNREGRCPRAVQRLVDALTSYERGQRKTADVLMAMWFAREQARVVGLVKPGQQGVGLAAVRAR